MWNFYKFIRSHIVANMHLLAAKIIPSIIIIPPKERYENKIGIQTCLEII